MNNRMIEYMRIRYLSDPRIRSLALLSANNESSPSIDGFDFLLLIVTKDDHDPLSISHYIKEDHHIQERRLGGESLQTWIISGKNRSIIPWIMQSAILIDHDGYLHTLKEGLRQFPVTLRDQKLLVEFTLFIRSYLQSREYLEHHHVLDAYSLILESLQHWGRIAVIEQGIHPEITVWKQVQKLSPEVYKLYEELTLSQESLEERVELVLLACDFSIMSKMKSCCRLLFQILAQQRRPCSANDLKELLDMEIHVDLSLLLRKLYKNHLIQEIIEPFSGEGRNGMREIKYALSYTHVLIK